MPVFHDVAQYSEEYDRLKIGIPTSSNFHKIITPQGKPSKQWREYACVLIAERILQQRIEFYNSPAMERGLIVEAEAADWYEFDQDVTVQRIGFITDDEHTMGCSPDRLVGDDGLLEIKAPATADPGRILDFGRSSVNASGLSCRVSSTSPSEAGSISSAGMTCCQNLSMRVEPDEKFIKALDRELQIFNFFIESVMEKIRATHELPIPPSRLALRAALRASLDAVP